MASNLDSRLQWKGIAAPNLTGTSNILANASRTLNDGLSSAQGLLEKYQAGQQERADSEIIGELAKLRSQEDLDGFLNSGALEGKQFSESMRTNLLGLRDTIYGYDQAEANIGQTNAQTDGIKSRTAQTYSNIGINEAAEGRNAYDHAEGIKDTAALRGLTPLAMAAQQAARSGGGGVKDQVYSGLIARGMPEHVAQGFMMNFQDESGFKVDITEGEANVHGTYGKGLYQLTGSRRDAYEAKYGNDYSVDNQLDWLMSELGGSESSAGQAIFNSKNAGEAGAAIVSKFLRPAEQHRVERSQRYLGGSEAFVPNKQKQHSAMSAFQQAIIDSGRLDPTQAENLLGGVFKTQKETDARLKAEEQARVDAIGDTALRDALVNPEITTQGGLATAAINTPGLTPGQQLSLGTRAGALGEALPDVLAPPVKADPVLDQTLADEAAAAERAIAANPQTSLIEDAQKFESDPVGSLRTEMKGIPGLDKTEYNDRDMEVFIRETAAATGSTPGEVAAAMKQIAQTGPNNGEGGFGVSDTYGPDGRNLLQKGFGFGETSVPATLERNFPMDQLKQTLDQNLSPEARNAYASDKLSSTRRQSDRASSELKIKEMKTRVLKLPEGSSERKNLEAQVEQATRQALSGITPREAEQRLKQHLQQSGMASRLEGVEIGSTEYERVVRQIENDIKGHPSMANAEKELLISALRG